MKASPVFTFAALLALSSCDKIKEAAGNTADAALERAKEQVKEDIKASIEDTEIVKSGREYADKAKAAMAKLDPDKLKTELEQVKSAVESGDYATAEKLSQSVDKFLDTEVIGNSVDLMKIRAEQGAEAAQRKLAELRALPNLAPEQKQFFEKVGSRLSNIDAQDKQNAVTLLTVAVACAAEWKLGHGGGGLALMALNAVFPGIVAEDGSIPSGNPPEEAK
jgi:hypothetical protein